ncbi:MAG: hypothetical protein WCJ95_20390 [Mariniphaga sp.]
MKKIFLCCLLITLSIFVYSQKKNPSIDGTWKLVEFRTVTGSSQVIDFPGKNYMDITKIWSGNHFMCVGRTKVDTTVSDMYGTGTYKLEGNRYEENVKLLFYKPWEGQTIKMLLEIKNDTLIQTYPVDAKGQMEKEAWIEKYIRVKK